MTAVADPLDVHIPKGARPHARTPDRSGSSRSFFQALNSIDMSDRAGLASSDFHNHGTGHPMATRRHHSFGNIDSDGDDSPDAAATIQRIMSEGLDGKRAHKKGFSFHNTTPYSADVKVNKPPKNGHSFHDASHTKRSSTKETTSFHTASSGTADTIDVDQHLPQSSPEKKSGKVAPSPIPAFPFPTSKVGGRSNRPIERRPIERKLPVEDVPEKETPEDRPGHNPSSTMQVIDLLWHDLRGIQGTYSGQINSWIQPHGFGSLVLVDGTTITCKWYNGTPLDRRRSDGGCQEQEGKFRRSTRRSSDGTHDKRHRVVLDESTRTSESDAEYKKCVSEPIPPPKPLSRRPTYQLGDTPQCSSHMVIPKSMKGAIENANSLNIHEFAFVLRSNGDWCYAIVAKKNPPSETQEDGVTVKNYDDANILFVTDTRGSTKCIKMKHWGKLIRLVNL
jgi:hypothetical protein